jgi:hypothetical protein
LFKRARFFILIYRKNIGVFQSGRRVRRNDKAQAAFQFARLDLEIALKAEFRGSNVLFFQEYRFSCFVYIGIDRDDDDFFKGFRKTYDITAGFLGKNPAFNIITISDGIWRGILDLFPESPRNEFARLSAFLFAWFEHGLVPPCFNEKIFFCAVIPSGKRRRTITTKPYHDIPITISLFPQDTYISFSPAAPTRRISPIHAGLCGTESIRIF